MKLSIFFYPNRDKINAKTSKVPLYMRIILNRQKAEMRLNIDATETDLEKWDVSTMRFADRTMPANIYLNDLDQKFEQFKYHNATTLNVFDPKKIRDLIMGLNVKPTQQIASYIDQYYQKAVEQNTQLAEGTKRNYRKAFKHLKDFLSFRKSKSAELKDLDVSFAYEFKDYLLGKHPGYTRVGMKEPSALDNIKRLRTVFDRAVDEGLLPGNPFKKIKLKAKTGQRGRLDIHQIKKIYFLDLTDFRTQQIYKDMFLFSVFTGLAYADASELKQTDLHPRTDGNTRLLIQRAKTDIVTEMILPKQAVAIIDKYRHSSEIEITGRALPKRSNKEVNIQLKILANMVDIPLKLTTHICRHTFRQLLAEADIYEMGVIKRMMGHSSRNDIDGIYYSVTENRLLEAKRKFELYLEKAFL